jgi:heme exporter protein C
MRSSINGLSASSAIACVGIFSCFAATTALAFVVAPTEVSMGDLQRILYLHVSMAWCGLISALAMGVFAAMYLARRRLAWDEWSQAVGEISLLCTTLTLITGSAWAREAWGTWWTWDPRLTSSLLLWLILVGILLVRSSIEDPRGRARIGGVLALVGVCDVPLIVMATRWFRGIHPVSPEMTDSMRLVLFLSALCFFALFAYLTLIRRRQLELAEQAAQLEADILNEFEAGPSGFSHSL